MKKKMLTEAPKPKGKGKIKQAEREHDEGLGEKMTAKLQVNKKPRQAPESNCEVPAGSLRGVMGETIARVYGELWPSFQTHDENGNVDVELAEEAYILGLTMVLGNGEDTPRMGLKIKDAEISENANYCEVHGA